MFTLFTTNFLHYQHFLLVLTSIYSFTIIIIFDQKRAKTLLPKRMGGHGWISTPLDPSLGGRPVLYLVISFSHRHCIHRPKFARKCTRSRNLEPNFLPGKDLNPSMPSKANHNTIKYPKNNTNNNKQSHKSILKNLVQFDLISSTPDSQFL